jgi:hypothetical protein
MVVTRRTSFSQPACDLAGSRLHGRICGIAQDANTSVDGQRTRRPTVLSVSTEPDVGILVIHMGWIEERRQDVHVQQENTQASSRNLLMVLRLGLGACGFGTKSRMPFRTFKGAVATSDCLASREMTCPRVTPSWRAKPLAASRRSSSSSNVVRMLIHHTASPIRLCDARCFESALGNDMRL